MGEWKIQIPTKLPKETVERIDELVARDPLCPGRSTIIRHIVEKFLRLMDAGMVQLTGGDCNGVPGVQRVLQFPGLARAEK